MIYDYGPDIQFNISTTGDMLLYNGPYESINAQGKYLLQAICHMVYQIKNEFEDEVSTIQLNDTWIMKVQNCYSLYTSSMMTVFSIKEVGKYSYEFEFFSPAQFKRADSFINYASAHAITHGKSR